MAGPSSGGRPGGGITASTTTGDTATQCQDPRPRLETKPADNNQVPSEVARVGEHQRAVALTLEQLDELDTATEGQLRHLLL
jgi:hypothetical protein